MAKTDIEVSIDRALVEDLRTMRAAFIGLCGDIAISECWPTCSWRRPCPRCQLVGKMQARKREFMAALNRE